MNDLLRICDPSEAEDLSSDVWLTPPELIDALGPFDLDPCAWEGEPNRCAASGYTIHDDGLSLEWGGVVWMNPPYSDVRPWLARMADHGNGIALVHSQTCSEWFHAAAERSDLTAFVRGRVRFIRPAWVPTSKRGNRPAYASILFAYGAECVRRVRASGIATCMEPTA